jgi:aspartate kinase
MANIGFNRLQTINFNEMKVFKFGGASIQDAASIERTARLIQQHGTSPLIVVVSALGKTTNSLERILMLQKSGADFNDEIDVLKGQYKEIATNLFADSNTVQKKIESLWQKALIALSTIHDYDACYDSFVSWGEKITSVLVAEYLIQEGVHIELVEATNLIVTDSTHRNGNVDWDKSWENISPLRSKLNSRIILTQGFIAADVKNNTTTLGREGSDFSAAIFAYCLDADSVTIWKDVPGIMNADPKRLAAAQVFTQLPYKQAAEMTYYGASVIHPKTIKPLANKKIPLYVKNFDEPELPGTIIHDCHLESYPPVIVFKDEQCLISCKVTDYTFIDEHQLSKIFHGLSGLDIHINMMQNSAISFSFCIDFIEKKVERLISILQNDFEVFYNTGLQLITIKNYNEDTYTEYTNKSGIMLEQHSRNTLQVLLKV